VTEAREDIGHGVTIRRVRSGSGELLGLAYWHWHKSPRNPSSEGCLLEAFIALDTPQGTALSTESARWHLDAESPLTISPSLLCPGCGHHGFIRGGKWVPA
jgi:hypothetical protein